MEQPQVCDTWAPLGARSGVTSGAALPCWPGPQRPPAAFLPRSLAPPSVEGTPGGTAMASSPREEQAQLFTWLT